MIIHSMISRFITIITIATLLGGCASVPPNMPANIKPGDYSYTKEYIRWYIKDQMDKRGIVGLSIALVDDQKIIWQEGFGYADKENNIKATPQTRYRAGSISKIFNAIAVMQLREQGKLDIDQPLEKYLPSFSIHTRFGNANGITPRSIMTHHSGLPGDWIDEMWSEKSVAISERVDKIKDEYVAYAPNTIMAYSNLGVTLLGDAIQKIAGMPYADFMNESVLRPMGMTDSHFERPLEGARASKAYSQGSLISEIPLNDIPAGGLNTSVEELSRLAMLVNAKGEIAGNRILNPRSLETMFTQQNTDVPLDIGNKIGLAWFIDETPLADIEPVYAHSGGTIAHRSHFAVARQSKLGVVVLANSKTAQSGKIANQLLQHAWEAKTGNHFTEKKIQPRAIASDFSGVYMGITGKLNIEQQSADHYRVAVSDQTVDLNRKENGRYYANYSLFGFIPIEVDELSEVGFYTDHVAGYDLLIGEEPRGKFIAGVKVSPTPIHSAWMQRLGYYELLNPPPPELIELGEVELKIEDEFLVAVQKSDEQQITQILRTVDADAAIFEGLGRGMRETARIIVDNQGEVMTYSGLRFRRVR
jgi:CubicO group peptidase (beta-lactamase class C family)